MQYATIYGCCEYLMLRAQDTEQPLEWRLAWLRRVRDEADSQELRLRADEQYSFLHARLVDRAVVNICERMRNDAPLDDPTPSDVS